MQLYKRATSIPAKSGDKVMPAPSLQGTQRDKVAPHRAPELCGWDNWGRIIGVGVEWHLLKIKSLINK